MTECKSCNNPELVLEILMELKRLFKKYFRIVLDPDFELETEIQDDFLGIKILELFVESFQLVKLWCRLGKSFV